MAGHVRGQRHALPQERDREPRGVQQGLSSTGPAHRRGRSWSSNLDRTAQRIMLTRNPKWWGTPPLLDSITYLVLDDAARIPALQNNTIDAVGPQLARRARPSPAQTPGISIRRAPSHSWYHFTFNGAPGSILADKDLRLAVAKGHRPAGHRRGHPARPGRQPGHPEQPRLRRRPEGLSGQQRRRPLRPGEGQAGTRRTRLDAERTVPGEGRQATGDPRRDVRLAEHQADRPDRAEQPRSDRRQARAGTSAGRQRCSPITSRSATSTSPSSPGAVTRSRCAA